MGILEFLLIILQAIPNSLWLVGCGGSGDPRREVEIMPVILKTIYFLA